MPFLVKNFSTRYNIRTWLVSSSSRAASLIVSLLWMFPSNSTNKPCHSFLSVTVCESTTMSEAEVMEPPRASGLLESSCGAENSAASLDDVDVAKYVHTNASKQPDPRALVPNLNGKNMTSKLEKWPNTCFRFIKLFLFLKISSLIKILGSFNSLNLNKLFTCNNLRVNHLLL